MPAADTNQSNSSDRDSGSNEPSSHHSQPCAESMAQHSPYTHSVHILSGSWEIDSQ